MPILAAAIPAVIGAGASIYGASQSRKATNKASAAQEAAAQQQLAAQQANFDRISGMNQPFVDAGRGGLDQLMREFGIGGGPSVGRPRPRPSSYDAAGNVVQAPRSSAAPGQVRRPPPSAMAPGAYEASSFGGQPETDGGYAGTSPLEAAPQGSQIDGQSYWDANPDLAADQSLAGFDPGDLTGDGQTDDADRGAWHYQQYGQNENRPGVNMLPGDQGQEPEEFNPYRPQAAAPPQFEPRRDVAMGSFGAAPDMENYFAADKFKTDPGYGFRVSEALKGVNAASAARGKLRSGDAAKALLERSSGLADQSYNNWFGQQMQKYGAARGAFENDRGDARSVWQANQGREDTNRDNDRAYGTSIWQTGVNRGDNNFNTDRGYFDDRADNRTNNLFRLTGVGLQGAGNVSGAGTNQANQATNIYGNQADARGDAAYARAGANSSLVSGLGNAASNVFQSWGGTVPTTGRNAFNFKPVSASIFGRGVL